MSKITTVGRPPDSKNRIIHHLRKQILDGRLSPGTQLPTRAAIELQFKSGPGTVQRAIDDLAQDGFVQASGRGTFVSENPPHLSRYALVLPGDPETKYAWPRQWTALLGEAVIHQQNTQCEIPVYYVEHPGRGDYGKLERDVLAHRVAGLIFVGYPHNLTGSPILTEPNIPRVAISGVSERFGISAFAPDWQMFLARAMEALRQLGRRRIALLIPPDLAAVLGDIAAIGARHGLEMPSHWVVRTGLQMPEAAREYAQLLWDSRTRPDGLIIANDNFVEHALAGLVEMGVRFPKELSVIAHCNFPWPVPSVVPIRRLGFDMRQMLLACIGQIDAQRSGAPVIGKKMPALFEDEIEQTTICG